MSRAVALPRGRKVSNRPGSRPLRDAKPLQRRSS
jgi:hypothetical protein